MLYKNTDRKPDLILNGSRSGGFTTWRTTLSVKNWFTLGARAYLPTYQILNPVWSQTDWDHPKFLWKIVTKIWISLIFFLVYITLCGVIT
jgi:hypothetical protein